MANLRDIINAATPGPWRVDIAHKDDTEIDVSSSSSRLMIRVPTAIGLDGFWNKPLENAAHIAAYSPDHTLLIEDFIFESDKTTEQGFCRYCGCHGGMPHATGCSWGDLLTYRKEHGLES